LLKNNPFSTLPPLRRTRFPFFDRSQKEGRRKEKKGGRSIPMTTRRGTPVPVATAVGVGVGGRSGGAVAPDQDEVLGKQRLLDLLQQVSAADRLDTEATELLLDLADDFVENVTLGASQLAKHRGSSVLEAADVLLYLEQAWNLPVPVSPSEAGGPAAGAAVAPRPNPQAQAKHAERLAFIRKIRKT
jgi:histone H3/H4